MSYGMQKEEKKIEGATEAGAPVGLCPTCEDGHEVQLDRNEPTAQHNPALVIESADSSASDPQSQDSTR